LRGGDLLCEGKTGWRVLLQNRDFSDWWSACAKIRTDFRNDCGGSR
jgi:hypothetical protein